MADKIFPGSTWQAVDPGDAGFNGQRLGTAVDWLDANNDQGYRLMIIRDGYQVLDRCHGFDPKDKLSIASAAKSIYSNILGIAVQEGALPTADTPVVDVYPEMMDVPEGTGPKEGRYAFPKDRDITYRQLISNTSGYMKPGEDPGKVFNYQTYGMNVLTHALAKRYGLYDVRDPEGSPGFKQLIEQKIGSFIGTHWGFDLANFQLHAEARLPIFGYYCQVHTDAADAARVGWLWCNYGRWQDTQVVPEVWMRASVDVNPDLRANCPEEQWLYGHGFWTNAAGKLWPNFPRDGFTASGAGGHYISVFPSLSLVIVQNPGPYRQDPSGSTARGNPELLGMILDSLLS